MLAHSNADDSVYLIKVGDCPFDKPKRVREDQDGKGVDSPAFVV